MAACLVAAPNILLRTICGLWVILYGVERGPGG